MQTFRPPQVDLSPAAASFLHGYESGKRKHVDAGQLFDFCSQIGYQKTGDVAGFAGATTDDADVC